MLMNLNKIEQFVFTELNQIFDNDIKDCIPTDI